MTPSMLDITVHSERKEPLYLQVAAQISAAVAAGRLQPGERLPTVRDLAAELTVNRLTVHRAYRKLQADGVLEATVGRGTFVRALPTPTDAVSSFDRPLTADRVMADIQEIGSAPGMMNLAHAEPDPTLIPARDFWDCLLALRDDAASHLQYASPQGDAGLRRELAAGLAERGIEAEADEILVTNGVTQAMSLVAQALARPGDRVAVEQPTYLGLLHILEAQGLRPIGIPLDREGPRLDLLERAVARERPRFFYTIASFQNPTGRLMSESRRRDLVELADRHGLFLLEDDIYHRLAYDSPVPRSLKSLDRSGLVIYLDGFSKAILPGLRVGFAVAPRPLRQRLVSLRRAADLCGSLAIQRALAEFLRRDGLAAHLRRIIPVYRRRRDLLLRILGDTMPAGVEWTEPEGGYCCWLTLPERGRFGNLYRAALDEGVVVAPGEVFQVEPGPRSHLRLCYGNRPEDVLQGAVEVLAGLIRDRLHEEGEAGRPVPDGIPLV